MLNPFPDLLTYSLMAPFLLRVMVGLIFLDLGILAFKGEKKTWLISLKTLSIPRPEIAIKIFGGIEALGGAFLLFGFNTQITALVLALFTFAEAYIEYKDSSILKRNFVFYTMLLVVLLSLLLSGAGAFAIDLPL